MGRSNFLRLSACALMLVDHLGAFLFPERVDLRIFGRLAFPLFAYLVAEGYFYTRDVSRYAWRLFVLACLWQPFHLYFVHCGFLSPVYPLNVLYTLLFGLILIVSFERYSPLFLFFALIFPLLCEFALVPFDYGAYGAFMVLSAHVFRAQYCLLFLSWGVLSTLVFFLGVLPWIQLFAPFAVLILVLPFSVPFSFGRFFYWFYPLHLFVLFLLRRFSFLL